jgi:hypothetical protein
MILEFYYKNRYGFIYKIENTVIPSLKLCLLNISKIITFFYFFSTILSLLKFFYELIKNPQKQFVHFDYHMFLVAPFYWIRYLNIKKFGKYGTSTLMGVGNHDLSQYWFYTKLSLFLFYKNGALFQVYSGLLLATSIIYCSDLTSPLNLVILLIFFSSKFFHYFIFVAQNYNAIGWSIVPLYIYFINTYEHLMASVALLAISFLSFTAAVCLIFISIGFSLEQNSWLPILYSIPCIIKILTHILPNLLNNNFISIKKVASAIGFNNKTSKYKYNKSKFNLILFFIYILIILNFYYLHNKIYYSLISILILFIFNFKIARFADNQTFDCLFVICLTSLYLTKIELPAYDLLLLVLLSNSLMFVVKNETFCKNAIFDNSLSMHLSSFLSKVPSCSKIFCTYRDPQGVYDDCFEGQRFLLDYLTLEGFKKETLVFPDYSALFDHNKEDSISLWANCPVENLKQLNFFKADYTICYQERETLLNPKWTELGFKELAIFDWHEFVTQNYDINQWWYGTPKWFLLEKPK